MASLYINELQDVANRDVQALKLAEQNYGDSWKKRGGIGAFMMLARKWDRIEKRLAQPPYELVVGSKELDSDSPQFSPYDIFGAVTTDPRPEGTIDDIRDLRRYLMLIEADLVATGRCPGQLAKDIERGDASKGSSMAIILEGSGPYRATGSNGKAPPSPEDVQANYIKDLMEQLAALKRFKTFVHVTLDNMGVPADPEPEDNRKHGCRISGRLKWIDKMLHTAEKDDTPGAATLHP